MHAQLITIIFDILSIFRSKCDVKMTKIEQNYNGNLNMNSSGIVCQLMYYLTSKHMLVFQSAIAISVSFSNVNMHIEW